MLTGRSFILVALMSVLIAGAALPAFAQSDEATKGLSAAYKFIKDGETGKAIAKLDEVLKKAGSDSAAAAKALLLRAQAREKAGQNVLALADYDGALWLQGLSSKERQRAVDGRKRTMARLGIGSGPAEAGKAATTPEVAAPERTRTRTRKSAEPWRTAVEDDKSTQSGSDSDPISSFLGGIFGGSSTSATPPKEQAPIASDWSRATAVTRLEESQAATAGAASSAEYRVQLAAVGTEKDAQAEARRLGRKLGETLGGRTLGVVRTDTSAGNTYYRIVVGPMPDRTQSQELCQKIKALGVDCLVVMNR